MPGASRSGLRSSLAEGKEGGLVTALPLDIAAYAWFLFFSRASSLEYRLDGVSEILSGDRDVITRAGVVELPAVDELLGRVEEKEVRRTRRFVRFRDLLGLVVEVGNLQAPFFCKLRHLLRGVLGVSGHVVGADEHNSDAPFLELRGELRELVRDVLDEGAVIANKAHEQRLSLVIRDSMYFS